MTIQIGKMYDFYYSTSDTHWSKRGVIVEDRGAQLTIEDEHGGHETINLNHIHFDSAKEIDLAALRDLSDRLMIPLHTDDTN